MLALAPQHVAAGQARRRAWKAIVMTESTGRRLVRPAFVRLSVVVLVLLVPLVVHAVWDYEETRRLRLTIAGIRSKGEPVTLGDLRTRPTKADSLRSDRYYRAAAVLAADSPEERGILDRVREAELKGEWASGLVDEMRRYIGEHEDALQLLDRAVPLTFEGFSPGAASGWTAFVIVLLSLGTVRAIAESRFMRECAYPFGPEVTEMGLG